MKVLRRGVWYTPALATRAYAIRPYTYGRIVMLALGLALMGGFLATPAVAGAASRARLVTPQSGCLASHAPRLAPRDCGALVVFWPGQAGDAAAYATALARPLCRTTLTLQRAATAGLLAINNGVVATRMVPLAPLPGCTAAQWSAAPITWQAAGSAQRRHHRRRVRRAIMGLGYVQRPASRVLALHTQQAARATPGTQAGALHLPAYQPLGAPSSSPTDTAGMLMLAGKFVLVLALLFICLRVLRLVLPRLSGSASRGGIVLHTESIGAKQTVQILDLGTRIVVIGLSGTSMAALTTIEDEEEMVALRLRYGPRTPMRAAPREQITQTAEAPRQPTTTVDARPAAERPTFAQALAIATARSLGRSGPALHGDKDTKNASGRAGATGAAASGGPAPRLTRSAGFQPDADRGQQVGRSAHRSARGGSGVRQDQDENSALGHSLDAIRALRRKHDES